MVHVHLDYVAAGCNRVVGALDWSESGLIAYAAHRAAVIYDADAGNIVATVVDHADVVTCVRWLRAADFGSPAYDIRDMRSTVLACGAGDGCVYVWQVSLAPDRPWHLLAKLPSHSAPVTSITAHRSSVGRVMLVSTGSDGDAVVWEAPSSDVITESPKNTECWRQVQSISLQHKLPHCSAVTFFPESSDSKAASHLLLALGCVDGGIRLYLRLKAADRDAPNKDIDPDRQEGFRLVCRLSGHQNWIRGVAFTVVGTGKILLASACQDRSARIWTIEQQLLEGSSRKGDMASLLTRYAPRPHFTANGIRYCVNSEAMLIGHEDWVHSVAWKPKAVDIEGDQFAPQLLTASMDRTMMLWVRDAATGLWLSRESVGDAGVNHLGYYTGVWSPTGDAIVAHGFTGALHVWTRDGNGALMPYWAVGGHFGPVVDAAWGVDGGCLFTVSTDQTARLTTRITTPGSSSNKSEWCEVARPQVHGHDFSCVAALPCRDGDGSHTYIYASGSEEKVIRVFQAPRAFSDTLDFAHGRREFSLQADGPPTPDLAYGATLPALGLSNRAVYSSEEAGAGGTTSTASGGVAIGADYYDDGPDFAPSCAPSSVVGRPLEEHLAQNTLWPEIHKLYGHGNEVHCIAADPQGLVLASACRAQTSSAAAIRLWDVSTWSACPGGELHAHTLTVTQLAFSPDGEFLASASRDRCIAIFRRHGPTSFELGNMVQKAHARIVWGLSWSHDSQLLATASRDGTIKVWTVGRDGSVSETTVIHMGESVQSVAFGPKIGVDGGGKNTDTEGLLACGLEGGDVVLGILSWNNNTYNCEVTWSEVWRTSVFERHAAAVRRVCWAEGENDVHGMSYDLASCSEDHSIRVYNVVL